MKKEQQIGVYMAKYNINIHKSQPNDGVKSNKEIIGHDENYNMQKSVYF